jgi:hypothetical protein
MLNSQWFFEGEGEEIQKLPQPVAEIPWGHKL